MRMKRYATICEPMEYRRQNNSPQRTIPAAPPHSTNRISSLRHLSSIEYTIIFHPEGTNTQTTSYNGSIQNMYQQSKPHLQQHNTTNPPQHPNHPIHHHHQPHIVLCTHPGPAPRSRCRPCDSWPPTAPRPASAMGSWSGPASSSRFWNLPPQQGGLGWAVASCSYS